MAREFGGNDKGTTAIFAPTSGIGAKLVLMRHVCFRWFPFFADTSRWRNKSVFW